MISLSQVQSWSKKGLSVACVTGECTPSMKSGVMEGEYQLVFYTRMTYYQIQVERSALDDVHI